MKSSDANKKQILKDKLSGYSLNELLALLQNGVIDAEEVRTVLGLPSW